MSHTLSISQPAIQCLSSLITTEQSYLPSTQTLLHVPSMSCFFYHGYTKPKPAQDPKNQSIADSVTSQQTKPKKKFNFKVSKNAQQKSTVQLTQKIYKYHLIQNQWSFIQTKGKLPLSRQNHHLISLNHNTLILYGGKSLQNQKILNDLHVLNLQTLLWKKLFSIECPAPSQNSLIIKLSDTKIIMVNSKQVWTFEAKDVKWELNTNQLPGGLWQNMEIKINNLINSQTQTLISGLSFSNQTVVVFTVDMVTKLLNSYLIDLNSKQMIELIIDNNILLYDVSNPRNIIDCSLISENGNQEENILLLSIKRKGLIQFIVLKIEQDKQKLVVFDTKIVKHDNQQIVISSLGSLNNQFDANLYFMPSAINPSSNQKSLKKINLHIQKNDNLFSTVEKKHPHQISGYLTNSQIQSIPEESNQSSLIGIRNNHNDRYEEFEDENDHYSQRQQRFMINSQRIKKHELSRPQSEVNRSPSVLSQQQKSEVDDNQIQYNKIYRKKQSPDNDQRYRISTSSNVYQSPIQQSQPTNTNEIQNNVSSFPEEQYLQSTLQKILVFEHSKRKKLEEKSQALQSSIKSSQTLSKILTKFATINEKNHHIEQIKYLKQELESIWNKEMFFRKEIQHQFVNESGHKTGYVRKSIDKQKDKNKGKINMKKLLLKHNLLEEQ